MIKKIQKHNCKLTIGIHIVNETNFIPELKLRQLTKKGILFDLKTEKVICTVSRIHIS